MLTSLKARLRRGGITLALCACWLPGAALASEALQTGDVLQYQPTVVTLEGEIDLQQFDGPPGYGDGPDDRPVEVPVLQLQKPVTVNPPPNTPESSPDSESARNVTEMQILSRNGPVNLSGCYRITGTLMHQAIADHYTTVVMVMNAAEPSANCH